VHRGTFQWLAKRFGEWTEHDGRTVKLSQAEYCLVRSGRGWSRLPTFHGPTRS
jgi:hypothetical protein